MTSIVLYKLPSEKIYRKLVHDEKPQLFSNLKQLDGKEGFVIAPFIVSKSCPIVLLRNNQVCIREIDNYKSNDSNSTFSPSLSIGRKEYSADFRRFHAELQSGNFDKLVLSRSINIPINSQLSLENFFLEACRLYPQLFVACFDTPATGAWLMATPELLLGKSKNLWHTMALAGTMGHDTTQWSKKNILEQEHVAEYIRSCLKEHATNIDESGPYSVKAGHLQHLQTDFNFTLSNNNHLGTLLDSLHPTPAVCGLPKSEALKFIAANEHNNREYYSGFAGRLSVNGETDIYVSLRCMKIYSNHATLFAGGGLINQSYEENEWRETEAKLQTMARLIVTHNYV